MPLDCTVVDAGARYGLHPTWQPLKTVASFHLFEMDAAEAERLTRKYAANANITVHPIALFREDTELSFTLTEHKALSSVYDTNHDLLARQNYMQEAFRETETRIVAARAIDSVFAETPVHFMKLDVEGAEADVLAGATRALANSVLGLRCEVLFAEVYKGAALFGALNETMLDHGFELLNLDYSGAGNKAGRFAQPGRFGRLISSDAVWTRREDRLFAAEGDALRGDVARLALFLFLNSAPDLAIDLLLRARRDHGVVLGDPEADPLLDALNLRALLHFKSLLTLPMFDDNEIYRAYAEIFGRDFPRHNQFFESKYFD